MLRYLTAGETHGKCLSAIIEGMPSNFKIDVQKINKELALRQQGYGRGGRMKIEKDEVEILSGVRGGKTLGSPICLKIENRDWENWKDVMDAETQSELKKVTRPRPGHADLTGALKYNHNDIRNVLERASARETAIRTAVGSIAEQLLGELGVKVYGHVVQIGSIKSQVSFEESSKFLRRIEDSQLRCGDKRAEQEMIQLIDEMKKEGDSLGGIFEVIVTDVPIGLGSCMHWDRKLDARIAYGLMSIHAIKGVEFGAGFKAAVGSGSRVHDKIFYKEEIGYYRETNNAGGIEGGMSNGENLVVRAAMKPIPTLYKPLSSVDIETKETYEASIERSDVCAVPAASIVGKAVVSWEVACALIEKFGGDSMEEVRNNYNTFSPFPTRFLKLKKN